MKMVKRIKQRLLKIKRWFEWIFFGTGYITTIKPYGTVSLLTGVTSGIEPSFKNYSISQREPIDIFGLEEFNAVMKGRPFPGAEILQRHTRPDND